MLLSMLFSAQKTLLMLAVVVLVSLRVPVVHGWGKDGHQIVANIAWKLLSNSTKTSLIEILSVNSYGIDKDCDESCSPLALVADWADSARYSAAYHWSAPLHYIDIQQEPCPITNHVSKSKKCFFNYTRDCSNDVCVAGAIVNYTSLTSIPNSRTENLHRDSLMFLVHFVGDIHQPLHCSRSSDKGGNDIHVHYKDGPIDENDVLYLRGRMDAQKLDSRVFRMDRERKLGNLHSFWDSFMIEKSIREDYNESRSLLEDALWYNLSHASPRQWKTWLECGDGSNVTCTTQWGEESLEYALAFAYRNTDGAEIVDGGTLTKEYYETRVHIVWKRLVVASVRLASTLSKALSSGQATGTGKTDDVFSWETTLFTEDA